MEVLIPVGVVPNVVGIGQDEWNLRAISTCCYEVIDFNWDEDYDWNCSKCLAEVPEAVDVMENSTISVHDSAAEIKRWVVGWTGLKSKDVKVKVKR